MRGEAADVHLVDDQVLDRDLERPVVLPVEIVAARAAAVLVDVVPVGSPAPHVAAADRLGVRVEQDLRSCRSGGPSAGSNGPSMR